MENNELTKEQIWFKEHYQKNKAKILQYHKEYYLSNKDNLAKGAKLIAK